MLSTTCLSVHRSKRLLSIAALLAAPLTVSAQDATPEGEANQLEEIVVTGTSLARASVDTPLAVTSFDEDRLAKLTANSQADILNSVPTIKAEGGGGEVAANVFIKGLPSGGQYQFTPLMYDGMPVFSSFGLNSSAFDVYYRNDLGIERLEFVRGGVSNLFGPGSVAGLINYISKTGSDTPERKVQLEVADESRVRGDFAMSGPLSTDSGLYYALSGFYRMDEGPIKTGNDTEGFQIRGNLKKVFADDSGSITLFGQYIDDQAQFYLPIPLNGSSRERIRGTDGREVEQVETDQVDGMSYNVPGGTFRTSIGDGATTKNGSFGIAFDKDLGNDWGVNGKARYADYDHVFDFFLDGDGLVNVPETGAQFLNPAPGPTTITLANTIRASRGLPATVVGAPPTTGTFTYADTGEAVPAGALLFPNRFIDRDRPAEDMSAEVNLTKAMTIGSFAHNFTVGAFYADAEAKDFNVTTMYLADFRQQARLVNLTLSDGTIISRNGLLNPGVGYTNNKHEAQRQAIYLADQMESDKFIFDIGARFESIDGDISRERSAAVVTDSTTPNLSPAQRDVVWGTGQFRTASVSTDEWAVALGTLYKLTDSVNIYANAARGFFFPEMRAVTLDLTTGLLQSDYKAEIIKQAEVGVKYIGDRLSGTLSALYTELDDRRAVSFVNGPGGSLIERVNLVSTESYGMEADFTYRLLDNLNVEGNVTWQEHEFTEFFTNGVTNPLIVGNELLRQPNILWNLGLYYDDGRFDAALYNTHTGDNFTTESNAIKLDAYDILRLGAGYTFDWGDMTARVGIDVYNLLDDDGITEGSPRQDTAQASSGAFFVGRPVLPRRYTLRFTVDF
jgi:iron complex outermembrane receptor protein